MSRYQGLVKYVICPDPNMLVEWLTANAAFGLDYLANCSRGLQQLDEVQAKPSARESRFCVWREMITMAG